MLATDYPISSYVSGGLVNAKASEILSKVDFSSIIQAQNASCYDNNGPFLLIQHIVDCTYALQEMMNSSKSEKSKPNDSEFNVLAKSMLSGFSAELIKIVISTLTSSWKESDSVIFKDYFNICEYILLLFPDLFTNINSDINLLHLSCKYVSPVVADKATQMILKLDSNLASQLDSSNQYPLHCALHNKKATLKNIELLLKHNRQALSAQDVNGFMPLHIALIADEGEMISEDIVLFLIEQYPQAVSVPDNKGRLPIQICASAPLPSVQIIKALLAINPTSINATCKNSWLPIHRLINRPHIPVNSLFALLHGSDDIHTDDNSLKAYLSLSNYKETGNKIAPKVVSGVNNNGQYPIHIYCDMPQPSLEIIFILARSVPASLLHRDNNSYLPLHIVSDHKKPNRDILMLLLYCDVSKSSLSFGIPYTIHGHINENNKNLLFPLHFLVGMTDDVDLTLCIIFAAFYPEAINYSNIDKDCSLDLINGGKVDKALIWSPYEKAVKRNLPALVDEFDKLLENEDYRLSIISEFNREMEKRVNVLISSIVAAVAVDKSGQINQAPIENTPSVMKLTEASLSLLVEENAKISNTPVQSPKLSPKLVDSPKPIESLTKSPARSAASSPIKKVNYFDIKSIYSDEADSEIGVIQKRIISKIYSDNLPSREIAFDENDEFLRKSKNDVGIESSSQVSAINEGISSVGLIQSGLFDGVADNDFDEDLFVGKTSSTTVLSNQSGFVSYTVDLKNSNMKRVQDVNNNVITPLKKDKLSIRATTSIIGNNSNSSAGSRRTVADNQLFNSPQIKINGKPSDLRAFSDGGTPESKPVTVKTNRIIPTNFKDTEYIDLGNNSTHSTPRRRIQSSGANKSETPSSFARSIDETV